MSISFKGLLISMAIMLGSVHLCIAHWIPSNLQRTQGVDSTAYQVKPESELKEFVLDTVTYERQASDSFERKQSRKWWFFFLLSLPALLAYLNWNYPNELQALIDGFSNMNLMQQMYRNRDIDGSPAYGLMEAIHLLSIGALIFLVVDRYEWFTAFTEALRLAVILGIFGSLYVLRHMVLWTLSRIFSFGELFAFYRYSLTISNRMLGIVIIPFVFLVSYSYVLRESLLIVALLTVVLFYIYKFGRGLVIVSQESGVSRLKLMLYICTLEISPILVVYKVFEGLV